MRSTFVRLWLLLLGSFAAVTITTACLREPMAAAGSDWPRFLGPTGNSQSTERGLRTEWGTDRPPIVWQCVVGAGYSIGAVADGRYFHFDRIADQDRLQALDARTGKLLWKYEYQTQYEDRLGYDNGPRCSPVVDDGRVYAYGPEGQLHCVRANDGTRLWQVDTFAKFGVVQNFFGVGATPVVFGNLLIVQVGGSPPESQGASRFEMDTVKGNGSGVVAFDKRNGAVRYTVTDELASYSTPLLATIDGRPWCFVLARGGLIGFNPENGQVDFHYPWRSSLHDSVNASTPVVAGNEVFISEAYGPGSSLLRVRPGGYDVVWSDPPNRNKAMQCHWNTPVLRDGYLYGSSGRHTGSAELRCIQWKTGNILWSQRGLRLASLLYVDGHLLCLSEDGTLRLLRATPLKFDELARWKIQATADGPSLLKPPAWAAPILSHGLLYVRGADRVVCLRLLPK